MSNDPLQSSRDRATSRNQYTVYHSSKMHVYHSEDSYCIDVYDEEGVITFGMILTNNDFKDLGNALFLEGRKLDYA